MNRTRIMTACYGSLIGIVTLLVLAPLAAAAANSLTLRAFPSWDQQINKPKRFKVLSQFAGAAVLDEETGLVWEQSPYTSTLDWYDALAHCYQREVGGRKGLRVPTIEELVSLVRTTDNDLGTLDLPSGHPFSNVQLAGYWSATTVADIQANAWLVTFNDGAVRPEVEKSAPNNIYVWCVRGGQGIDGVQ